MSYKITPTHLQRGAYIYVRQSTLYQVQNRTESRDRQYGLAERARTLGFASVHVIDDDLGVPERVQSSDPASQSYSPRCARVLWAQSSRWMLRVWRETIATGII